MFYIGIDIGGTNIKVGFFNHKKEKIHFFKLDTQRDKPADFVLENAIKSIKEELFNKNIDTAKVKKIGISCPGSIDEESCIFSPNLNWRNVNLKNIFKKHFDCDVKLWHDVKTGALAELKLGSLKDTKYGLYIALGTGLGSAQIIDGRIENDRKNVITELGHTVLYPGGEECACGRKGCVERYCSADTLLRATKKHFKDLPANLKTLFDLEKKGDETAKAIIKKFLFDLGEFLSNLANAYRPEKIVIGGGLSYFLEDKLPEITEYIKKHSYPSCVSIRVETGKFKNDASTIGSILLFEN